jgi:hypothetical protein
MQRILTKDLHLQVYKIQLTQEHKLTDFVQHREFVNWVLENQKVDGSFSRSIIFSDEAHFQLDEVGNGARRILECFMKSHYMHNEPLFGADFGLAE